MKAIRTVLILCALGVAAPCVPAAETAPAAADGARRADIVGRIRQRLSGKETNVSAEELHFLVSSGRRAVVVEAVEPTATGTVANVLAADGKTPEKAEHIVIDSVKLPVGSRWEGSVYPTGVKSRLPGNRRLEVFGDSEENAVKLLTQYLDIYSDFVEQGGTFDEKPEPPRKPGTVAGLDFKKGNGVSTVDVDEDGYSNYFGYYFGNNYFPAWSWWNYRAPYYPPCPRPPRPPRPPCPPFPPPCPPRPPRPPRPPEGGGGIVPPPRPPSGERPTPGVGVGVPRSGSPGFMPGPIRPGGGRR